MARHRNQIWTFCCLLPQLKEISVTASCASAILKSKPGKSKWLGWLAQLYLTTLTMSGWQHLIESIHYTSLAPSWCKLQTLATDGAREKNVERLRHMIIPSFSCFLTPDSTLTVTLCSWAEWKYELWMVGVSIMIITRLIRMLHRGDMSWRIGLDGGMKYRAPFGAKNTTGIPLKINYRIEKRRLLC